MGKHAQRASVFTDETGRHRLAATAVRRTTVGLLGIVGAVVVSLLSGVPLPGITPPVRLPSNERPARAEPPATPSATDRTARLTAATPSTAPGALIDPAPATPTPTAAPASSPSTTTAPTAGSGNRQPTSTPTTTRHGHPPATPPGRTKHP